MNKQLTDFEKGMKYNEALMFEMTRRFPNDRELGFYTRDLVVRKAKDNPYIDTIKDIAIKSEQTIIENRKLYKNKKR